MTTHVRRFAAAAALTAGALLLAGPGTAGDKDAPFKPMLPPEAYTELVSRAVKNLEEALAGKPDEDALRKARFNATMIIAYTLSSEAGSAATRDGARKLIDHLKKKKFDDAKAVLAALAAGKGEGSKDGVKAEEWRQFVEERADIMDHYRVKAKGGDGIAPALQSNIRLKGALNGIEEKIRVLANKPISAVDKEAAELELLGYRTAVHGGLTYYFAPLKKTKKHDPDDWRRLALEMRDAGLALAAAAKKKDGEAIFKAGAALNGSCNRCHSDFR